MEEMATAGAHLVAGLPVLRVIDPAADQTYSGAGISFPGSRFLDLLDLLATGALLPHGGCSRERGEKWQRRMKRSMNPEYFYIAISLVRPTPADTEKRCVLKKSCYILKYEFFLGLAHTQNGHFFSVQ
jgi:hypothetical protein